MGVRHVAMFRFAAGVTDEQRRSVAAGLAEVAASVPTIRSYAFGPDLDLREGTWDWAVVADFDDVAGFEAYRDDPRHLRLISEVLQPILAERAGVQFTT